MAVLVATVDGYHVLTSSGDHRVALEGHRVACLTPGPTGTWIAVVDDHEIWQHEADGSWTPLASSELKLTAALTVDDVVYAGTVGPTMLKLEPGATGDSVLAPLSGFDDVAGRDAWHPVGSPLHVRSLSATADGAALLANVHVGGILRSSDRGASWHPTIDVDADVHEVRAHPDVAAVVTAAAAVGLCVSRDGGREWDVVVDGLHATYARAVAFDGDDVLVSASEGPFARRSAIYRGSLEGTVGDAPLERVRDGLPEWLEGNVDTRCLTCSAGRAALADGSGSVWSRPAGHGAGAGGGWSLVARDLPRVNAVVVV
jgi:hypothetical protein